MRPMITRHVSVLLCLLIWNCLLPQGLFSNEVEKELRIILDTDFSTDADDVGAVAVLHSLARSRPQTSVLAMIISSGDPHSAAALSAVNAYNGAPEIPIGQIEGESVVHSSSYTEAVWRQAEKRNPRVYEAVSLYRKALANQPSDSVTIVVIGYLTNLRDLLQSHPDQYSDMNGHELVTKTVHQLVCMGGEYPQGREWNFYQDADAAREVVRAWPTKVVFVGYELGLEVVTGSGLIHEPPDSPVRLSYALHNEFTGRPSWDQLAVLYAVLPEKQRDQLFAVSPAGLNNVAEDGSNRWVPRSGGQHVYISRNIDPRRIEELIEQSMRISSHIGKMP
jgi:purine nucleosidase